MSCCRLHKVITYNINSERPFVKSFESHFQKSVETTQVPRIIVLVVLIRAGNQKDRTKIPKISLDNMKFNRILNVTLIQKEMRTDIHSDTRILVDDASGMVRPLLPISLLSILILLINLVVVLGLIFIS
jgi:hypothetical protein